MRFVCSALLTVLTAPVFLLAGCSPSTTTPNLPTSGVSLRASHESVGDATKGPLMFLTGHTFDTVAVYRVGHYREPVRQIIDGIAGAEGMAVDPAGNLYVANDGPETVEVYAPGASVPSRTYGGNGYYGPIYDPIGIAVARNGTLYVANSCCVYPFGDVVTVFPPNSTTPTAFLSLPQGIPPPFRHGRFKQQPLCVK